MQKEMLHHREQTDRRQKQQRREDEQLPSHPHLIPQAIEQHGLPSCTGRASSPRTQHKCNAMPTLSELAQSPARAGSSRGIEKGEHQAEPSQEQHRRARLPQRRVLERHQLMDRTETYRLRQLEQTREQEGQPRPNQQRQRESER